MRGLFLLALGALAVLGAACADEDVVSGASPTAIASDVATATAPSATATAPAVPTPVLGVPFPLLGEPSDARLVSNDDPEARDAPFLFDLETEELQRIVGTRVVSVSPYDDRVLLMDGFANQGRTSSTAVLDLVSGEVVRIVPAPIWSVLYWRSSGEFLAVIEGGSSALPTSQRWPAGVYAVDLDERTATLVSRGGGGRNLSASGAFAVASREGSVEVRDAVTNALMWSSSSDGDTASMQEVSSVWSPADDRLAVTYIKGPVEIWDAQSGSVVEVFDEGKPAYVTRWSPHAVHLGMGLGTQTVDGSRFETWVASTDGAMRLGPFDGLPLAWRPDGQALALLGDYCVPDGFTLGVVDIGTGIHTVVRTDARGFWWGAWSPDGETIAAGVTHSVYLINPQTGDTRLLDALRGGRDEGEWVGEDFPFSLEWSGSGRWLAGNVDFGRGRCE